MKKGVIQLLLWVAASCCFPYFVSAQCTNLPVQSLVYNGNFSLGNTGFVSGYNNCQTSNCLYPEGLYSIGRNANFYHGNFAGFDHTTGNGNYMIVNGTGVPNTIVWQQTITIKPATNYNFSVWVRSVNPVNPAALQFSINGTPLGPVFNAPAPASGWQQFFVTWNSGAGTSAIITILNQNTLLAGNDFGLDDISFIEICPTPQPNLGADQSLCGKSSIALNAGVTPTSTMSVTWSDGTTGTGLGAPYTRSVNAVGSYWVCVQDGTCYKKDTINIIADFNLELGPDVILCTPATINMISSYINATTSYKWYRNGVLIPDSLLATFIATQPGVYSIEVRDASCGLTKTDAVTVTSTAGLPNDGIFCPPTATFTVTPNPSGEYKWYDAPVGGNVMGKGSTIVVPATTTTTLYAEDTAAFRYNVGPLQKFPDGFAQTTSPSYYIAFDATTSFTLESVTVFGKVYNPNENFTIGVTLRDNTGAFIKSQTVNVVGPPIVPVNHDWPFTVIINMAIPAGTDLRLTNEGTVGDLFWASGPVGTLNNVDWASYKVPGIITFKGMDPGYNYCTGRCFPYFYNWVIKKGVGCARVPVTMVTDCPLPLDWLSFTANAQESSVLLNWETINEQNTSAFVIERSSDGKTFQAIGTVTAKGGSFYNQYTWTDQAPVNGTAYYRIKQTDADGSYTYSSVQEIAIKNKTLLFPVPASDRLNLVFSQEKSGEAIIMDMTGRIVAHTTFASRQDLSLSIHHLPIGVYLIEIKDQFNSEVLKWTKE